LANLRTAAHFRYWLTGIARQLIRESRRGRRFEPLPAGLDAPSLADNALDDSDEIAHVLNLVGQPPEQERLAIRVFFLSERSIADTAQCLELSRTGAYEVIKRACTRLVGWLGVGAAEREGKS
jgi:DNA-directed RNA polymerase specialized sigma24 family protein